MFCCIVQPIDTDRQEEQVTTFAICHITWGFSLPHFNTSLCLYLHIYRKLSLSWIGGALKQSDQQMSLQTCMGNTFKHPSFEIFVIITYFVLVCCDLIKAFKKAQVSTFSLFFLLKQFVMKLFGEKSFTHVSLQVNQSSEQHSDSYFGMK